MIWEDDDTLKLMVVDDEPDNLDLLYRTFRREFEVYKAGNGFQALELLAEKGEMAIIISDQRMPRMNGTEFLSRTVEQFPDTIRIVLTGYTDVEDLVEAINSGKVFKYITKPWDPNELTSVVFQAAETYKVVKKRTHTLIQALKRESFFNEVMSAIRESLDYNNMLQTIVTTLGKTFSANYTVLYAVESGDRPTVEIGRAFSFNNDCCPLEDVTGLPQHSLSLSESVLETGERKRDSLEQPSSLASVTLPLRYQQSVLAVVTLYHQATAFDWAEETTQLLETVAEQIALAISQAKLYQRLQAQSAKMRAELEVARQVQTNLLRQTVPYLENVRIQARCLPAREVGGDFYEIFSHPRGNIWLAVGDVSGKGVPAALFMASAISVLRRELAQEDPPSPERVMQSLNRSLWDDLVSSNCFITLVLACYNPATHRLTYANAGHIYPLVWSPEAVRSQLEEPIYLTTRGVPLGILPGWSARADHVDLRAGDTLLLTSDGLTEATVTIDAEVGATEMLRQTGLWRLLNEQTSPLDLDTLLQRIQAGRSEQEDDQTVLSLEVTG
ncbi:SpoIIE family protein phosphatase [Oscillatoria sp. CS-180]|uniref:SpoIIE family protein phosphatase n=1 Tax=Oscillatoria sp. CS-180 TaxID=3021720 RepID=UPI00232F4828|nr:SpoIIE family protein phosphatase [Oscillatoria sp. CS-180]MDB9528231.1 SpoIIE family protein phosphatase [Oscillatoria sp. CS-180]